MLFLLLSIRSGDYFMKRSQDLKANRAKYDFFDGLVLAAALILSAIGVLMVFSITGTSIFNNRSGYRLSYMLHSATGVVLGVVAMGIMAVIPNRLFRSKTIGFLIFLGTMGFLLMTLIVGHGTDASPEVQRWITIPGVITFQAVDLARIGFVLAVPWFIQRLINKRKFYSNKLWSHHIWPLVYVVLCTFLVFQQPDLGSSIAIFVTGAFIYFSSGIKIKQIIFLGIMGLLSLIALYFIFDYLGMWSYQESRLEVWHDPFNHDDGRQIVMGFVSIALGGWRGVGIGESTQTLGFAIEPHTDLIVTILSEELGVIYVFFIMILYLLITFKCFSTALKARDVFSALVCIGVGSFFLVQPFINLGGVVGFIPLSGVTLPLISYGMTSKVSTFILIGIYFNMRRYILIDVEKNREVKEEKEIASNILQFSPR